MADSTIDARTFDWRIYADATCAGLSALIPLPLVDILFETVFRRRIPGTIAKARGRQLPPETKRRLGRGGGSLLSLSGCFAVPIALGRYVLRRLWRKVIYIFAMTDAATSLTEYWHRAYLIDHMVRADHLSPGADADLAIEVSAEVLEAIDPGPLMGLARQTVSNAHQVLRLLVRARRLGAAEVTQSVGEMLSSHWRLADASLRDTAVKYNARYRKALVERESIA